MALAWWLIFGNGQPCKRPIASAAVKASPAPTVSLHRGRQPGMLLDSVGGKEEAAVASTGERDEPERKAIRERGHLWDDFAAKIENPREDGEFVLIQLQHIGHGERAGDDIAIDKRIAKVDVQNAPRIGPGGLEQRADGFTA